MYAYVYIFIQIYIASLRILESRENTEEYKKSKIWIDIEEFIRHMGTVME